MSWPVVALIAFIAWAVGRGSEKGKSDRVQTALFHVMLAAFVAYLAERKGEKLSLDELNDLTLYLKAYADSHGRES